TFAALINKSLFRKTTGLDKLHLSLQSTNPLSPEMKETQAYKTYLGFAIGDTPPKKARKFKKPASPKLTIVDVTLGKGIELLSQVALTEDARFEEVRKKGMRDFHKTHPSGSGTVTKTAPSVSKIKPSVTSEGTGVKPGVPDVAEEESSENSDQEKDSDDDKTQSDNENESDSKHETDESKSGLESDHEENEEDEDDEEAKITDKVKADEDEEIDYTASHLYDDVDIRMNEPVDMDKGFVQEEGTDAAMNNIQQGNENLEILQFIEDAYVTLSTVPQKTEVLVTSSSHSSDLAAKFLNFSDIPHIDVEVVSPMDVHVHHEVPKFSRGSDTTCESLRMDLLQPVKDDG
nr:hypothetical protein [Tanacetum cinerariifolium]